MPLSVLCRIMPPCYPDHMATVPHPNYRVDVLLYREDGQWVAHCLQLDLVEVRATPEEAEAALDGVIQHHVQWAIEDDDMEHLFHPAPPEILKRFYFSSRVKGIREIPVTLSADEPAALSVVQVQQATDEVAA